MITAIYTRQSLEKKDSISLESQANFCLSLINDNEEYKIYSDSGWSGKNIERPQMQQLLTDIKSGKISKVLVYKLDRISRSVLDFNRLLELFKKYNVEFNSYSENLDTTSPIGRAMINIISVFAQLEREQTAERVRDNYYQRAKQGSFLGGTVPYGFNKSSTIINGKKVPILVPNEQQQEIIKYIFSLYAQRDLSLGDVQRILNSQEIKSAKGTNWDSSKVSKILRSPLYVRADSNIYNYYKARGAIITSDINDFQGINGCFIIGKRKASDRRYTDVTDHQLSLSIHEGFIESDTFLKCQYKLDKNVRITNSGQSKISFLSGLFKCAKCSSSMQIMKSGKKSYILCRGKYVGKCEGSKTIHLEEVEQLVANEIQKKLQELKSTKLTSSNLNAKTINEINIKITKIDEEIQGLLDKILEATPVVMEYINKKVEELDKQRKKLLGELQSKSIDNSFEDLEQVLSVDFAQLDFDKKREVARTLIDKIELSDEVIRIRFKT